MSEEQEAYWLLTIVILSRPSEVVMTGSLKSTSCAMAWVLAFLISFFCGLNLLLSLTSIEPCPNWLSTPIVNIENVEASRN
jgi:hypothetical protein